MGKYILAIATFIVAFALGCAIGGSDKNECVEKALSALKCVGKR